MGDRLRVQVQSPGDPVVRDLSIELRPRGEDPIFTASGPAGHALASVGVIAMPAVCLALGFWMLFRKSDGGSDVFGLDAGGPVIGLMEDCCYTQGRVTLEPDACSSRIQTASARP